MLLDLIPVGEVRLEIASREKGLCNGDIARKSMFENLWGSCNLTSLTGVSFALRHDFMREVLIQVF